MASDPIVVYGYSGWAGLFDLSPFVAKLEAYLKLAEVAYDKRPGDARKAPRGKLPFIAHQGQKITDSQRILEHLAATGVADLDATLDGDQRAELFALRSMLENDFYFILVFFRWQYPPGWAQYSVGIGEVVRASGVPGLLLGPVLKLVRKNALSQVFAQGTGRREVDENLAHARELVATLDWLLGQRDPGQYWFGEAPTSADAIAYAFLSAAVVPKLGLPIEGLLDPHPRLRAWFEGVDARLRPGGA